MNYETMADAIVRTIKTALKAALAPRDREIADLKAALEAKKLPTYTGTHEEGKGYPACSLVTRSGSLWLSTAETNETPGSGATKWRLIVKRGDA